MADPVKIDLGGGRRPKPGFLNVDRLPPCDYLCDLESEPLPFADGSVDEVFSSHALEHLGNLHHVLREVVRVCREGARFELRVPHWLSDMAMCPGHRHTISPTLVRHWCEDFPADWFGDGPRRLRLAGTSFVPSREFAGAQEAFAWLTAEQIMRFVPGACHESVFVFEVVSNG